MSPWLVDTTATAHPTEDARDPVGLCVDTQTRLETRRRPPIVTRPVGRVLELDLEDAAGAGGRRLTSKRLCSPRARECRQGPLELGGRHLQPCHASPLLALRIRVSIVGDGVGHRHERGPPLTSSPWSRRGSPGVHHDALGRSGTARFLEHGLGPPTASAPRIRGPLNLGVRCCFSINAFLPSC